jgi:hypothetical protein
MTKRKKTKTKRDLDERFDEMAETATDIAMQLQAAKFKAHEIECVLKQVETLLAQTSHPALLKNV